MSWLEPRAIAAGAALELAGLIVGTVLFELIGTAARAAVYVVVVLAFAAAGGFVAASLATARPLTQGLVAGVILVIVMLALALPSSLGALSYRDAGLLLPIPAAVGGAFAARWAARRGAIER